MTILVGMDGSNASKEALNIAKKHAKAFNTDVIIVTSMAGGNETQSDDVEKANEDLAYAKKYFADAGIQCSTKMLVRGLSPGEDIVSYGKEKNVEEIIIGIKRHSKVGKLLFGSNAQHIILNASCPVVTVQ